MTEEERGRQSGEKRRRKSLGRNREGRKIGEERSKKEEIKN